MQPTQRRILFVLILVAGLGWIFISADKSGVSTAGEIPAPREGFLAPDFSLQTPEGETVSLSQFRSQAVLVNLWATWCPPCRAEMPAIQKLYEEYKDQGLQRVETKGNKLITYWEKVGIYSNNNN